MLKQKIESFYGRHYKKLALVPIVIILFSLVVIGLTYAKTGDFIEKDITLKGGVTATVYYNNPISENELIDNLRSKFNTNDVYLRKLTDFSTGKQIGFVIESSSIKGNDLTKGIEELLKIKLTQENYSMEETGPSLGESFYKELLIAVLFAFLLMSVVVLITFRTLAPSFTVILCAFTDIIATLAVVDLLNIKLSTGGIAAFLMLIGYSVDTDILLTTRVLKRKDAPLFDRIWNAAKPGLTMTITTIAAVTVGYFASPSLVMKQIFLIIAIGGVFDIINTWISNTSILYIYCKKKGI